jgi:hypothetical protein
MERRPKVIVVCSDRTRTGKSLLARLFVDYLLLAWRDPFLFDTSPPPGDSARFYPERSLQVDLSSTRGQMALFDTILASSPRDFVIDLAAAQLERFFDTMAEISFLEELEERGYAMGVVYISDTDDRPLELERLAGSLPVETVTIVLNEGLTPFALASQGGHRPPPWPAMVADVSRFVLPALDPDVAREASAAPFSFAGVVEGWMRRFDDATLLKLLGFLNRVVPSIRKVVDRLDQPRVVAQRAT